jgi:HEAT repeat protein
VDELVARISQGRDVQAAISKITFLDEPEYAARRLGEQLPHAVEEQSRRDLAMALSQVRSKAAEAALLSLTQDKDSAVRMSAAQGLGRLKSRASTVLFPLLADSSLAVRREAARALGTAGDRRAGKALLDAAKREAEPDARAVMLVSAGAAGDRKQIAALEGFLRHSSESTRFAAAQGLCRLGAPKGVAFVRLRLAAEDRFERRRALELLEGAPGRIAALMLKPLLADKDPVMATTSARLLLQAGDSKMLEWLVVGAYNATGDAKMAYEDQLELLHLTDEQRSKILTRAGLVKQVSR